MAEKGYPKNVTARLCGCKANSATCGDSPHRLTAFLKCKKRGLPIDGKIDSTGEFFCCMDCEVDLQEPLKRCGDMMVCPRCVKYHDPKRMIDFTDNDLFNELFDELFKSPSD